MHLALLCLTFLNPDGPYRNPIIVDSSKEIEIEIVKYQGMLRYDSTEIGKIKPKQKFRVKFSNRALRVVRLKEKTEDFADKLERIIKRRMIKDYKPKR